MNRMKQMSLIISMILIVGVGNSCGQNYRGAELRTLERFQYGRFEASINPDQGDGFLASFFTYNDSTPANDWAEIDFEILGRWNDNVDVNVIDENGSHLRQNPLAFDAHRDFHSYAMEWTPDYVAWFVDGAEIYRQSGGHIDHLSESSRLMMNIWTPVFADWVGIIDDRILPRFSYYDWVSYAAYTPGEGTVGSNSDFSPVWLDNFDEYDSERWEKIDGHSWNGNTATMVEENIVYQDGYMILCLTLPSGAGLTDNNPPHALWARAFSSDSLVVRFSEELDPFTANATTTYSITGASIQSVFLQSDQRTVSILVDEIDLEGSANVFALGLRDLASPVNTQMGTFCTITMPDPLALPINIDCAGPGTQGFLADQVWSHAVEYGHEGGNYQLAGSYPDLVDTDLDSVMASSLNRFSRYHVRLAPGLFNIQLHFAEHAYDGVGERIFEVYVEDSLVIPDLDVFAEAGNTGVFTLTLSGWEINDGSLDFLCAATTYGSGYTYSGPVINAIQVDGEYFVGIENKQIPEDYFLSQIYPNPFNSETQLKFTLPQPAWVDITLYDMRGAMVRKLASRNLEGGQYKLALNADDLSSGVYIVMLDSEKFRQSRKLVLLK
ncbi:family 16 glycosylhydrolase [bacterium]|nr:family 16 glycosylhydrolase [bacterium]